MAKNLLKRAGVGLNDTNLKRLKESVIANEAYIGVLTTEFSKGMGAVESNSSTPQYFDTLNKTNWVKK